MIDRSVQRIALFLTVIVIVGAAAFTASTTADGLAVMEVLIVAALGAFASIVTMLALIGLWYLIELILPDKQLVDPLPKRGDDVFVMTPTEPYHESDRARHPA